MEEKGAMLDTVYVKYKILHDVRVNGYTYSILVITLTPLIMQTT